MNEKIFEGLKEKHPKAHLRLGQWMGIPSRPWGFFKTRDLYDFFDVNGIYVELKYKPRGVFSVIVYTDIDDKGVLVSSLETERGEGELKGFWKAFEIMEGRL